MDALLLIIFLAFVFFKVLGKMPEIKDKLPKDWEPKNWGPEGWPHGPKRWPEMSENWGFPWEEQDPYEEETDTEVGRTENQQASGQSAGQEREVPIRQMTKYIDQKSELEARSQMISKDAAGGTESRMMHQEGLPPDEHIFPAAQQAAGQDTEGYPLFNSQALLNGIILSEVLQVPKSKRGPQRKGLYVVKN